MTITTDNAEDQAKAQLANIKFMMTRLEHAQQCDGDCDYLALSQSTDCIYDFIDSDQYHDEDEARERIQEHPASVQVRSDWVEPGVKMVSAEYEILLMTGGPAVRIIGDLGTYGEPDTAHLEYQDWGTPWTELFNPRDPETLVVYACNFFFGD